MTCFYGWDHARRIRRDCRYRTLAIRRSVSDSSSVPSRRCDNPWVSGGGILEREQELDALSAAAEEAKAGDGSVVLIVGEAGIGKSSLVNALSAVLPADVRLLVGYCDDLATPRVLGPLRDLTGS